MSDATRAPDSRASHAATPATPAHVAPATPARVTPPLSVPCRAVPLRGAWRMPTQHLKRPCQHTWQSPARWRSPRPAARTAKPRNLQRTLHPSLRIDNCITTRREFLFTHLQDSRLHQIVLAGTPTRARTLSSLHTRNATTCIVYANHTVVFGSRGSVAELNQKLSPRLQERHTTQSTL